MTNTYSVVLGRAGLVAFAASLSLGTAASTAAAEPAVATEIRALFEAGWKPSIKGWESALAHAERAKQLAPNDVRVPFATALVYMKNSKLENAATELDAALAGAKLPLLPIRRARIYIAAITKNYPEADREMRALATQITGDSISGDAEQSYRDSATFLGNVVEYLSAQGGTSFKAEGVAALDKHIQASLQGQRAAAYAAARAATGQQRTELEAVVTEEKAKALAENTQKRADALEKIETPVIAAQKQAAGAVEQDKTFRAASEADRARHEPAARQALAQLQNIDGQLNTVQKKIRDLRSDIDKIKKRNDKARNEKPPKREESTRDEERELTQNDNKARDLQREKSQLEANPAVAFMRTYNGRLQQLAGAIGAANQNLGAAKKKADNQRGTLTRAKVSDNNTKSTTLDNEIKALSTFTQLALDAEKERILASYRPK